MTLDRCWFIDVMKVTATTLKVMKQQGRGIASLTAYDYPTTRLLDEAGIPLILVGDSVGMVVLGYPDTTLVTMEEMEHHTRAAARAKPQALLAADMPHKSYDTVETAIANARRLVTAGAEAVKAEGGRKILPQVKAIVGSGIPFIGHLGMLPQSVREEGGYKIKGKSDAERQALMADAKALEDAGACAIVLELVTPVVAKAITESLAIPTIGIGSGADCDGQILVIHDLVGAFPWFTPKFIKPRMNGAEQMRNAISAWSKEVHDHKK